MDAQLNQLLHASIATAIVAITAVAILAAAGVFGPRGLSQAPYRGCPLAPVDLLVALGIYLTGIIVFQGIALAVFGDAVRDSTLGSRQIAWMSLLSVMLSHLPVALWTVWRAGLNRRAQRTLGLLPRAHPLAEIGLGALALLAVAPLVHLAMLVGQMIAIGLFDVHPDPLAHETLVQMRRTPDTVSIAIILLVVLLAAPVLEEIVFRGLMHNVLAQLLGERHRWMIIVIASIIFTLVHAGIVGTYGLGGLFVLSITLGWLYERTGSLWPPIVLHLLFNAVNTLIAFAIEYPLPDAGG